MKLVTLDQARLHLRSDTDFDDLDLDLKIRAASAAVMLYLKDYVDVFTDSAGEVIEESIPPLVQDATLILIGFMDDERNGSNKNAVPAQWGYGYLPAGVEALLYPLRRPTVI